MLRSKGSQNIQVGQPKVTIPGTVGSSEEGRAKGRRSWCGRGGCANTPDRGKQCTCAEVTPAVLWGSFREADSDWGHGEQPGEAQGATAVADAQSEGAAGESNQTLWAGPRDGEPSTATEPAAG